MDLLCYILLCYSATNVLLSSHGTHPAAASPSLLGLPDTACLASQLLPSAASPTNFDTRSHFGERWLTDTHPSTGCVSRVANFYGQLTKIIARHISIKLKPVFRR